MDQSAPTGFNPMKLPPPLLPFPCPLVFAYSVGLQDAGHRNQWYLISHPDNIKSFIGSGQLASTTAAALPHQRKRKREALAKRAKTQTHKHTERGRAEPSQKLFSAQDRAYWRMLEKMSQHTRHVSLVLLFPHIPHFPHFPSFVSFLASLHIPSPLPSLSVSLALLVSSCPSYPSVCLLSSSFSFPFLSFLRSPSDSAHCAANFS
ncbi:hypothetical protein Mapa_016704 [Marchantia paleacea]|nr:hypothetical protein Mapa_016704 [Marchantia paleacea]